LCRYAATASHYQRIVLLVIPVPFNIAIFALFGLAYGWVLYRACLKNVYHVSGVSLLDRGVLVWLIGLFAGITLLPALYLGFGFHEFAANPVGQQLTRRLQLLARSELAYACLYGLLILATVQQRLTLAPQSTVASPPQVAGRTSPAVHHRARAGQSPRL
jgi:hypothetical protein